MSTRDQKSKTTHIDPPELPITHVPPVSPGMVIADGWPRAIVNVNVLRARVPA